MPLSFFHFRAHINVMSDELPTIEIKKDPDFKKTGSQTEKELGGPAGPEPTRYGDWESNGKCVDF